jgi:hypothetical protein
MDLSISDTTKVTRAMVAAAAPPGNAITARAKRTVKKAARTIDLSTLIAVGFWSGPALSARRHGLCGASLKNREVWSAAILSTGGRAIPPSFGRWPPPPA